MLRKVKKYYLVVGLLLLLFSVLNLIAANHNFTAKEITALWTCNWLSLILISEYTTLKLKSNSLFALLSRNKKNLLIFLLISTLGGLAVEGIGQWIGKLWFYPFFTLHQYQKATTLGFSLYMTTIAEVYIASKSIIDRFIRPPKIARSSFIWEKKLYPKFLLLGILFVAASLALSYRQYEKAGGYFFDATKIVNFHISFFTIIMAPLGIWLICEYIENRRRQMSFLKDISREYWNPLLAIILSTLIVGFSMEIINLRYGYWVYVNWPLQQVRVFNLPVLMIGLAWPLHFVMFLSMFRAIAAERSINVWSASTPAYIRSVRNSNKHRSSGLRKVSPAAGGARR
jgi:hypothetical protein